MAIAQHHDAVTGTEKQHVANDYAKRLSIGYTEVQILTLTIFLDAGFFSLWSEVINLFIIFLQAEKVVASSLACLADSKSSIGCGDSATNFQQVKSHD